MPFSSSRYLIKKMYWLFCKRGLVNLFMPTGKPWWKANKFFNCQKKKKLVSKSNSSNFSGRGTSCPRLVCTCMKCNAFINKILHVMIKVLSCYWNIRSTLPPPRYGKIRSIPTGLHCSSQKYRHYNT